MELPRLPRTRGRQLNAAEGRSVLVKVTLTPTENAVISAAAKTAGVSRQRLMVDSVLADDSGATRAELSEAVNEFLAVRRKLLLAGNNINQIAAVVNAGGGVEGDQLAATLTYLRQAAVDVSAAAHRVRDAFA